MSSSACATVVDPGVGSHRRAIAIACGSGAVLVGPDNGLLSMAWDELGGPRLAAEITSPAVRLEPVSETFHGRDVFAPAAAHLAGGMAVEDLGPAVEAGDLHVVELPGPMVAPGVLGARVVGVDGFGNVQLNVTPQDLEAAGLGGAVQIGSRVVPRARTFADVDPGSPAAFIDSQGYLALAVNGGSAAQAFGVSRGDAVVLSPPDEGSERADSDRPRSCPSRSTPLAGPAVQREGYGVGGGEGSWPTLAGPGSGARSPEAIVSWMMAVVTRTTKSRMMVIAVPRRTRGRLSREA